jgi:hypothetical protein
LLEGALGELVRAPLTEIQTVDQVRASRQGQDMPASDIPPEVATLLAREPGDLAPDRRPRVASVRIGYAFILPDQIARGELRPLRDPRSTDDEG